LVRELAVELPLKVVVVVFREWNWPEQMVAYHGLYLGPVYLYDLYHAAYYIKGQAGFNKQYFIFLRYNLL
jgi:hypothetical protein